MSKSVPSTTCTPRSAAYAMTWRSMRGRLVERVVAGVRLGGDVAGGVGAEDVVREEIARAAGQVGGAALGKSPPLVVRGGVQPRVVGRVPVLVSVGAHERLVDVLAGIAALVAVQDERVHPELDQLDDVALEVFQRVGGRAVEEVVPGQQTTHGHGGLLGDVEDPDGDGGRWRLDRRRQHVPAQQETDAVLLQQPVCGVQRRLRATTDDRDHRTAGEQRGLDEVPLRRRRLRRQQTSIDEHRDQWVAPPVADGKDGRVTRRKLADDRCGRAGEVVEVAPQLTRRQHLQRLGVLPEDDHGRQDLAVAAGAIGVPVRADSSPASASASAISPSSAVTRGSTWPAKAATNSAS